MQVIVCDDDIENLNEMIQVCYDVLAKGTEVRGFSDASMLAEALQAGMVQPALLLLDIEMPALTGLELREQMASKLRMTDIIYVTSHEEMMEAAFGRNVIAFVRKTGNWDKLTEVLQNFQREHQRLIDVTWKKKVWQIDVSQILYIQSADNYSQITFYLRGEVVQALQTYTMKEWEQILQEQGFCRISRFVIVNYAYVEDIQKTSLIMEDSMRFNIPNGKVRRLRQEYIAYAREHERVL
ncbi:MAG: LytR/AlgR family response regulator transcription factor [Coprococcus sp.]